MTPLARLGLSGLLLSCGLSATVTAWADIYQFIGDDGTPHFSDQPTDARFRLLLRADNAERSQLSDRTHLAKSGSAATKQRFEAEISAAALANRIDANLLHAVIQTESSYNPKALSPKGAKGLMQLMPATARRYGVSDPFDAIQNVQAGALHLRELLDLFSGDTELALAAYNAGTAAVLAHGRRIPPFAETTRYVPTVLRSYDILNRKHRRDTPS